MTEFSDISLQVKKQADRRTSSELVETIADRSSEIIGFMRGIKSITYFEDISTKKVSAVMADVGFSRVLVRGCSKRPNGQVTKYPKDVTEMLPTPIQFFSARSSEIHYQQVFLLVLVQTTLEQCMNK